MLSLPKDSLKLHNYTFKQITLTLIDIKDVSGSLYSQYTANESTRQLYLATEEDSSNNNNCKSNRILKLTLTDGEQIIYAMEMKPLQCLNVNLNLKSQITIRNSLVRRGVILLDNEANVSVTSVANTSENKSYLMRIKEELKIK